MRPVVGESKGPAGRRSRMRLHEQWDVALDDGVPMAFGGLNDGDHGLNDGEG